MEKYFWVKDQVSTDFCFGIEVQKLLKNRTNLPVWYMGCMFHKRSDYPAKGQQTLINCTWGKASHQTVLGCSQKLLQQLGLVRHSLPASLARLSTAPDLPTFSLPARSTYTKETGRVGLPQNLFQDPENSVFRWTESKQLCNHMMCNYQ